jgi:hypothetical protein
MKTTNKVLSISLAVVIALSVFALPYNFGIRNASASVDALTLTTSADDHDKKFFGDGLLQVIAEDPSADDDSGNTATTASVTIKVRSNTGSLLGTFTKNIDDTTDGSQRFEFFIKNETSTIEPQDPDADSATIFTVGAAASSATHLGIGQIFADKFTVEITFKSKTTTITYTDSSSEATTDRDEYGSDNLIFLSIVDQDGNADPTNRDLISVTGDEFVTMDGVTSFDDVFCTETGDNTAEFECEWTVGDTLTPIDVTDNTIVVTVQDVSKYMNDSDTSGAIEDTDDDVAADNIETGQNFVSITINDQDGELSEIGAVTTGSELKFTLTDPDRNISSKSEDDLASDDGTFTPGTNSIDELDDLGVLGVFVYIDAVGGDSEAVPMTETADGSGIFVPDLPNDELKVSFLAAGQTATPNNGVLEFTSANVDEDIIIAYIDSAPDGDPLTSSLTKELSRVAGTVTVDASAGVNSDFKLTLTDSDLDDNPRSRDSYKLVLRANGDADADSATEFQLVRGSTSLSDAPDALYGTFEVELNGDAADFGTPGLNYTFTETGIHTGIFVATLDMGEILDTVAGGADVDDGDTFEFTYHDYMEDTEKESHAKLTIGRATTGVDISRDEAPIPPLAGDVTDTALGSDEVVMTLTVTDSDLNTQSGSQDTLPLDTDTNIRVEVDGQDIEAETSAADDDPVLKGGVSLQDILVDELDGLTLEETGANTGVFSEELHFHRGGLALDDWQDLRVTFVYIDEQGDEESAGVTFRGHDGVLDIDKAAVKTSDTAVVTLQDEDLNLDDDEVEEFDINFNDDNALLNAEIQDDDITTGHHQETFTETGPDTGIFTATFDIGTDIKVIDTTTGDQSTNIHWTYNDEIDSSGEEGDQLEVDTPVVSATASIQIKPDLVGPGTEVTVIVVDSDLNEHPDGKDVIDADDTVEFRTDRNEVGKDNTVDMEETGANTGVFQFTVQLITDQNDCADDDLGATKYDATSSGDEGEIGACPGDLFSVKYTDEQNADGQKTTVSKVVEISSWDPEFAADKDSYNIGDKAVITISDPDANRDSDVADTLRDIRVTSDTDQVGEEISAIETGKDTGVFKLSFALTGSATSGGVEVKSGDTVSVRYTDDFPADFVDNEEDKDFQYTFTVGTGPVGDNSFTPTPPSLKDVTGNDLSSVTAGQQVILSTTVVNNLDRSQPFAAIVEVRDSSGVTIFLAWQTGTLNQAGQTQVGLSWMADNPGDYTVRTFVISDLNNPQILSKVMESHITVS